MTPLNNDNKSDGSPTPLKTDKSVVKSNESSKLIVDSNSASASTSTSTSTSTNKPVDTPATSRMMRRDQAQFQVFLNFLFSI
jgi:hypothetical protein